MVKTAENINEKIGKAIRARRTLLGLSQDAVAKAVGITFQQIQKYENGSNSLNLSRLFEVSKAVNWSPLELIAAACGETALDSGPLSERGNLELMKSFCLLTDYERRAIHSFMKSLVAGRKSA